MKKSKPLVGVSQCLLGDAVRYDGQSKKNRIVLETLSEIFKLVPVCPEIEAGLSVPRPPVQLTNSVKNPRLTGRDQPALDITDVMQRYCGTKIKHLNQLSGFIFKSRSPSCGLNSTPVYIDGYCVTENSRGIFAKNLCLAYPKLAVIEDTELVDKQQRERFILAALKQSF